MSATPRFSVLMPAFNEARHLAENLRETAKVMDSFGVPYEILVVDDHSRDETAKVLETVARDLPVVRPILLPVNQGKGHALRAGFEQTRGELIFFLDADLDLHPRQFHVLHRILQDSGADVVIGSKRHPDTVSNYPWKRRIVSAVYFWLVKLLFGLPIKDTQTGIKLFKRETLERTFHQVLVKKYAFDLELLVLIHRCGFKIAEAPVVVNYKTKFGHIGFSAIFNIWWDTMAVWYRLYIRHYYHTGKEKTQTHDRPA
jgi:glycosyltransferase involved in cell wall biosynthesis